MRIKSLALDHFRGVTKMIVGMNGRDTSIYGANGTGKTTIANAICWLLCDAPCQCGMWSVESGVAA